MKYLRRTIIGVALILSVTWPALTAKGQPFASVTAQKGILDLRSVDLSRQSVRLYGEWAFYWRRLLQPGDTVAGPADFIAYPSLWKNIQLHGRQLPSQGYASYTLTIILPPHPPNLGLLVPDSYCSYRLFVNDSLLSYNGVPDTSASTAVPFWNTQTIQLPTNTDTLHLLLQVANFWHTKGGTYKVIEIGEKSTLDQHLQRDRSFDILLAGCLLMGGLFFFGFFVYGSRDKAILYFSLFCIVYSYRMTGTSLYALHWIFPHLSWFFTIRIEYLSLTLAVALFTRYFYCVYPKDANLYTVRVVEWLCLSYSFIIIVTPTWIFTKGIVPFLVVMFLYIGYAFYICIRAVQNKRLGAVFALLSCSVMLLVFLVINLNYFALLAIEKWIVFTGYVLFFFLQSLVLSHRFSYTLKKSAEEAQLGLKAKTEFLSTMSHEIRTPLNVVIGMTHLLLQNKPRDDQEQDLNVLLFSANNLLAIVNDILDYNKIEAGKVTFEAIPMDVASIVRNIVAGLNSNASEKNIELRAQYDNQLTTKLIGDPTRTSQVIYNLVHNAIKFTKEGSVTLSLTTDHITDKEATLTFRVIDTGIGIEPDKQQLIFDRFTQADSSTSRSYGGTGLGLAITKRILELQGVTLLLESEPGKGSVFYFTQTFPLSSEPATAVAPAHKTPPPDNGLQGVSILVVEDNPFNVIVAKSLLERGGAVIDIASNGLEALEKIQPGKYQIVLMDLNMPEMDGYEATRKLRERGEKLPIIALTASLPAEVEKDVQSAGLTDIVVKPFDPDELFRVIAAHMRQKPEVVSKR
jgi:signal transduction histidine kinase/ActR/RegA family two-component response regulator